MRSWLGFALVGLVAAAVIAAVGAPPVVAGAAFGLFATILPALVIVLGLPVLIHELGHFAAARRLGVEVVGFDVFGVSFMHGSPRNIGARDPLGYVQVRTTLAQDRPEVWRRFLLAGPMAGLAFAATEAALAPFAPPALVPLLIVHIINGLTLHIGSLLPSKKERVWLTDGQALRDVRRSDSQIFATAAYARVVEAFGKGDILGIDPEDVRRSRHLRDPFLRVHATGAACYHAFLKGAGGVEAAHAYLRACDMALASMLGMKRLEQVAVLRRDAVFELAFAQAFEGRDVMTAEATLSLLDRVEPEDVHNALRVDAALAWSCGDEQETRRRILRARAHLDRQRETKPSPAWNLAERLLALIEPPAR